MVFVGDKIKHHHGLGPFDEHSRRSSLQDIALTSLLLSEMRDVHHTQVVVHIGILVERREVFVGINRVVVAVVAGALHLQTFLVVGRTDTAVG